MVEASGAYNACETPDSSDLASGTKVSSDGAYRL